jgi:lipopolysaccharide/colanic/teichoic acid biosynthesis glycosyltransferase
VRVTHLGKFYPPVPGGMERVLQALCEGERALGSDSSALVVGTTGTTVRERVNGVPVTRAGSILRVGSVWLSPALIRLLRRDDSDVLVLHEPNPMALLAYAIARPRQRLIVWYHSEVIRPRWRYRAFYHPFVSFALRRAARVVASSPALLDHATALTPYRDRAVVVPFGLSEPSPPSSGPHASSSSSSSAASVRSRWHGPIVLFVGRLVPYKGVDVLLRAMQGLRAAAVIVGDGPLRTRLEHEATAVGVSDRVFFLGTLPEDTLADWYRACDVLALPSTTEAEAFGLVQLEAMARAKPVVSTRVASGVPWVNQDGVTGLTVPPGDADALRSALARILETEGLAARMGDAGRRRFHEHFTHRRMVERTTALYADVAAEPSPEAMPLVKRAFDVALSGLGLALSAPVWAVAAVLIKLEDRGPVFYRQDRVGLRGTTFTVLKFRSMVPDAERDRGPLQAVERDPRVTRVGRLLRATAMDELPQLVNILRGDMSFVGPRALRPGEIDAAGDGRVIALDQIDGYHARTAVQPGLTGIAQIYAPRDVARRQKFRYDLVYVRRRSFWLDLRLILLSFWISLRGTWEHRERKF